MKEFNMHTIAQKPVLCAAGGVIAGLALGIVGHRLLPGLPVHASATQGLESCAIATGLADNNVEAVYFLDYLTGELKGAVMNPQTREFGALFTYNVAADFRAAGVAPAGAKYMMVTGLADLQSRRGGGNNQLGKSIVYVAEENSGLIAAYAFQWNPSMLAANRPQDQPFVLLDVWKARSTALRE
jgi:hypothetical protein